MVNKGVTLHPFQGIRFNADLTQPGNNVAPPYDVFEYGDSQDQFLRQIEHSIVHIQKPMGEGDKKYLEARRILEKWEEQGILIKDDKPYYYIYEQETEFGLRRGIIAASDIDDSYTKIRRHEKIKSNPIVDRLKLTIATGLNIGLIFTIFQDENSRVSDFLEEKLKVSKPFLEFKWSKITDTGEKSEKEITNRVYMVQDPQLEELLSNRILYIADGHHRYQTMIEYRDRMRLRFGHSNGGHEDYEKTMLFAAPDKNMIVLGYHRIVKGINEKNFENFIENIERVFVIIKKENGRVAVPGKRGQLGIYYQGNGYLVEPKEGFFDLPKNREIENLDVFILQQKILGDILKIDDEMVKSGKFITYPNGEDDPQVIKKYVDNKTHQAGFTLYPTSISQLMNVADAQEVMPQKSTYFYPKLLTGLVLNKVAPPSDDLTL